jgi:hypothetical protein
MITLIVFRVLINPIADLKNLKIGCNVTGWTRIDLNFLRIKLLGSTMWVSQQSFTFASPASEVKLKHCLEKMSRKYCANKKIHGLNEAL